MALTKLYTLTGLGEGWQPVWAPKGHFALITTAGVPLYTLQRIGGLLGPAVEYESLGGAEPSPIIAPGSNFVYRPAETTGPQVAQWAANTTTGALTRLEPFSVEGVKHDQESTIFSKKSGCLYVTSEIGGQAITVWKPGVSGQLVKVEDFTTEIATNVRGLAMHPNGLILYASASSTASCPIWVCSINESTGALTLVEKKTTTGNGVTTSHATTPLAISPDGANFYGMLTRTNGNIFQFSVNSEGKLTALSPASIAVTTQIGSNAKCLAMHPSGNFLVAGGANGGKGALAVVPREAEGKLGTAESITGLSGNEVRGVAFSPDGELLLTAETGGTATVFVNNLQAAPSETAPRRVNVLNANNLTTVVAPDALTVAVAAANNTKVVVGNLG